MGPAFSHTNERAQEDYANNPSPTGGTNVSVAHINAHATITPRFRRRQVDPALQSHIGNRTPGLQWVGPHVGGTTIYIFKQRKRFQLQSEISIVRTSLCILQTLGFFNLMVCHEMRF